MNTSVGSSPNTGGTAAIAISTASLGGHALRSATGVALNLYGDLTGGSTRHDQFSDHNECSVLGPQPAVRPAVQDRLQSLRRLHGINDAGSPCAIYNTGSGGLNGYINISTSPNRNQGVVTATYCTFTNLGTSSIVGVSTHLDYPANTNASITNCSFVGCSYQANLGYQSSWDGNYTFQYNSFSNSVAISLSGIANCCASFSMAKPQSTGTRLIDHCSFDLNVANGKCVQPNFTNIIIQGNITFGTSSIWSSSSQFSNVLLYTSSEPTIYGPVSNLYYINTASTNPRYIFVDSSVTNGVITGCIFQSINSGAGGVGDCIFPPTIASGTPTLAVTYCIVIADSTGKTSGNLVSAIQTAEVAITCEHNTFMARAAPMDSSAWEKAPAAMRVKSLRVKPT